MLRWLRDLFRRQPPSIGPRHVFVQVRAEELKCLGLADDEEVAHDMAEQYICEMVMATGDMVMANYYAKHESTLNKKERAAVEVERARLH